LLDTFSPKNISEYEKGSGGFMHRKDKNEQKKSGSEMHSAANMSLSINYGDVVASVKADKDKYVAKITGKVGEVEGLPFHQFVIRFIRSIESASKFNETV
jgi:hypothetical protein